jgi:hypothetical protein
MRYTSVLKGADCCAANALTMTHMPNVFLKELLKALKYIVYSGIKSFLGLMYLKMCYMN